MNQIAVTSEYLGDPQRSTTWYFEYVLRQSSLFETRSLKTMPGSHENLNRVTAEMLMHLTRMQYCQQVKYGLKACPALPQSHEEMALPLSAP